MLNQLLKFTLISSLLLWLKPRWRGLLAIITLVILVHVLHGEYLGYVELSGDRSMLIWSYVFKWVTLAGGTLFYILYVFSGPRARVEDAHASRIKASQNGKSAEAVDDGFDFLRNKKKLQSRADKLISQHKRDS